MQLAFPGSHKALRGRAAALARGARSDGGGARGRQEHEVFPLANPAVAAEVAAADGVVYAMGSLFTSICPPLVLTGVGCAPCCFAATSLRCLLRLTPSSSVVLNPIEAISLPPSSPAAICLWRRRSRTD